MEQDSPTVKDYPTQISIEPRLRSPGLKVTATNELIVHENKTI
jgi:hypothetical protein